MLVGMGESVRPIHESRRQDLFRGPGDPDRPVQQDQAIGVLGHVLDVVGGADDREPTGPLEVAEKGVEAGSGRRIETGRGLVQEQEPGVGGEGARDEHPLLLSSGEAVEAPMGEVGQPHVDQGLLHPALIVVGGAATEPQPSEAPHENHLGRRERKAPGNPADLRHVADRLVLAARGLTEDLDGAHPGRQKAQEELEARALSRPVGPDESREDALIDLQFDTAQDVLSVVGETEAGDADGGKRRGSGGFGGQRALPSDGDSRPRPRTS